MQQNMPIFKAKTLKRAAVIIQNALNSLLQPFFGIIVSLLVIRLGSAAVWGGFVAVMVVVQFGAMIASWGNKEYLLREFSRHPQPEQMATVWGRSFITRAALLLGLCVVLVAFFRYSQERMAWMMLWGGGLMLAGSFEVLVVYRKRFAFALLVEAVAVVITGGVIVFTVATLTVDDLVRLFALVQVGKAAAFGLRFRFVLRGFTLTLPDAGYLRAAFPFFLLGFSGVVATRTDLYAVSYFLTEREVGEYQVFINLMIYLQAVSNFILLPYIRNVYRMDDRLIFKIALRLFALGVLIVIPALLAAAWLLAAVYQMTFSTAFLLMGGAFALPIYAYLPLIYRLYKREAQNTVLWVNLAGAVCNVIMNIILLPRLGIMGAIVASAIMQWGMLAYYLWDARGAYAVSEVPSTHA